MEAGVNLKEKKSPILSNCLGLGTLSRRIINEYLTKNGSIGNLFFFYCKENIQKDSELSSHTLMVCMVRGVIQSGPRVHR